MLWCLQNSPACTGFANLLVAVLRLRRQVDHFETSEWKLSGNIYTWIELQSHFSKIKGGSSQEEAGMQPRNNKKSTMESNIQSYRCKASPTGFECFVKIPDRCWMVRTSGSQQRL